MVRGIQIKMIIDLVTNSEEMIDFVKEKEGFGGIIERKGDFYKLLNVQIGYVDRFSEDVNTFIEKSNMERPFYLIIPPHPKKL